MKKVKIKNFLLGEGEPLTVISGPCVMESREHTLRAAERLKEMFSKTNFHFIFKASYDKANRSSISSFRGPGLEEGLRILEEVKKELDLPVTSDVHLPGEARPASEVLDLLQIPAFLCRQTDLILACASTDCPLNIKKGQFVAPWDMRNALDKVYSAGGQQVMLTDRGTSFGYNNLVSDMRAIPIMQTLGVPVCFDASHSVQLPGGFGTSSGGQREFIPTLAKAAVAAGANALFIESHPSPQEAKSDASTVFGFQELPLLLRQLEILYQAVHTPL